MPILDIFATAAEAARNGELIRRASRQDKEFHFQNWFESQLQNGSVQYDRLGRNKYPDFILVHEPEGYEVKGLAYPGREANYDCNSQVPSGVHNGRVIFYVFGRYPADPDEDAYPVIDLVMCHGDFLNADHVYRHKNRSIKGFGSYGDIMIRDRKMYVAPTPFGLVDGVEGHHTLILPSDSRADRRYQAAGDMNRVESDKLVVGYSFDLRTNSITPRFADNPGAGKVHSFRAYRLKGRGKGTVRLKAARSIGNSDEIEESDEG